MLNRYDPAAQYAELGAFRDPSYPFTATDFQLGDPPTLAIADPALDPVGMGVDASIPVTVEGPGTLALKYLLVDPATGQVVVSGDATPGATAGTFTVDIGADVTDLFPGLYELDLAASSDQVGPITERRVDLEVTP